MTSGPRVLLIDGLSETEEVLRTVLEPRGLHVDRVRADQHGSRSETRRPAVVVLHEDDDHTVQAPWPGWGSIPRVIIGRLEHSPAASHNGECYLSQPFQYGELVRAIETLISDQAAEITAE